MAKYRIHGICKMQEIHTYGPLVIKIIQICVIVVLSHLTVTLVRYGAASIIALRHTKTSGKLRSIISLASSTIIFFLYFTAIGFLFKEFGISLTAYLASASVIGLAIGFGSQGLVQDVVTGLTVLLTDLYDVGDMVEISGQTGIVRTIGMRFTVLENSMGAEVFIPNRTISTVLTYPRGYVRCLTDITLKGDTLIKEQMISAVKRIVSSYVSQFPGISVKEPDISAALVFAAGKEALRIKFRLWPGRGGIIETAFRQEVVSEFKKIYPDYADWMVTVGYEVEKKKELK